MLARCLLAKAYATEALIRVGTDAIQIHGATGYMTEVDIHLYYLRSKWARPIYGDASAHYERAFGTSSENLDDGEARSGSSSI